MPSKPPSQATLGDFEREDDQDDGDEPAEQVEQVAARGRDAVRKQGVPTA